MLSSAVGFSGTSMNKWMLQQLEDSLSEDGDPGAISLLILGEGDATCRLSLFTVHYVMHSTN